MKHCPACRSQYTDDTLRFCLQDGAALESGGDEAKQSTIDTVSFSDPLTASSILKTGDLNLYAPKSDAGSKTRAWKAEPPKTALRQAPKAANSNSSAKTFLAAFGVLLVLAAAGLGGWVYLSRHDKTAQAPNTADSALPETAQKNSTTDNTKSTALLDDLSATNSNSELPSTTGSEDAKKEIAAAIELWKTATESRKLPDYLSRYAEKVDYFDKSGAGAAEIRAEAQKMFAAYSEIEITLTNVRVAVDAGGTQATAVFDKEWSFETPNDLLEGKARTKLRFQKSGADWKITSEKYQKIYYMEN